MSEPSQPISYTFEVPSYPEAYVVTRRKTRPYWLHLLLLLLTMFTTLVVGAQLYDNFQRRLPAFTLGDGYMPLFHPLWIWQQPSRLLMGIPFSVALMAILLAHEFGHFLLCEKYEVNATLPFFIPAPTLIGTMGAFIRIKSPIRSRRALFDIGVAGPIAGFVVAFPLLLVGLAMSKPLADVMGVDSLGIGFPAVFHLAHWIVAPTSPNALPLSRLALHPIAVAAWVGMFATALNLLPGGQLDGGHIIYAVAPRSHKWVSRVSVGILALLSCFWIGWLVWAAILGVTGWRHPPVPAWPELDARRRLSAIIPVILLALTIVPAPILGQGWF
ncbi:MAG TPA: site-2 protease family protein [Terriglobales bacterium]